MEPSRTLTDAVVIDGRRRSRDSVRERGARAATTFDALGVGPEQTVGLLLRNDFAFLEATIGAGLSGRFSVPMNWHNTPQELDHLLRDSAPAVVIGHADLLLAASSVLPPVPVLVVPVEGRAPGECPDERRALAEIPGARPWAATVDAHEPADGTFDGNLGAIIYTSGTTGRPKGVYRYPMDGAILDGFTAAQEMIFGMGPGARGLVLGPLYHSSPDSSARRALARADLLVMQSRFDPEGVLAAIEEYGITDIVMVPTMFVRLLALPEEVRDRYDVSTLRSVTHTGGPCPVEIKRRMITWWGPVINETYGGTEMGCAFFCRSDEWLRKPGTAGRPLEGLTFELVGADGSPVPPGEVGEIYARNRFYGDFTYLGRDDQRAEVARGELITLGDMGYVDADGYLFLTDRKRDMIISGGVNIYPAEIEAALILLDGVADCAVFGVPDEEFGESIVAAVQLVPGVVLTEGEVQERLRRVLSAYKVPRRVEFHDRLPREETGKIFKRKLRDPYWAGRSRAV
ncbi:acyl-CoA synthetase [Pseudonocardia halophobica]|uniref:Acyl-CoA synthetase n=1 Tax=Pseudonocardia halophobica TaxID=29401 RepID=A0A9W6NUT1_9PSEU|nr:AMP-binding protein [Pseudonocardia halophobica]GLL09791.1 acyl-CoA synthetase [Pseudonocardia halophobica]